MPHTYSITSSPAVDRDNMVTSILNAKTSSTTLAADVFDDILLNDLDFLFDCDGDFNMNMLPGATDLMANVSNANYTATNFEQPKTNTSKNTKMELVSRPSPLVADRTREEFPQRPLKQQRTSSHVQGYPVQPHNGIALMNPITSSSKSPPQPAPFSEGRSTPELKSSLIVSNFCLSGITGGRATAHGITAGNNTMSNTVSNLSTSVTAMMAPSSAVVNSKRRIPGPAGKLLHTLSSHPMITDTVNRHINMKQKQTNSTYPSTSGLYSKLLANPKADSHSATSTQPTSSQFPIQSYGQGSDEDLEWGSWQTMLQTLLSYCPAIHMHPQQRTQWLFANHPFFQHNIASILKQGFPSKIPFLVVFVSSFDPCNIDVFATFKDASGEIQGTIHRRVLENNPREITSGSVLVLRQVSVFSPSSRSHYLNITPDNVIQVFPAEHEIDLVSGNSSGADTLTRETPTTQATSVKVSKTSPRISVAFLAELQAIQNETQGISESFLVSRSTVKRELVSPTPMETDGMEPLLRQAAITEKPKDARSGQRSTQRFLPSSDASPHSTVTPSLIPTANSSTSFPSSTTKASSSSSATHCQVSPQVPPSLSPFSFLSERKKTGKLTILETPVNTVRNTTNSVAAVNLSTTAPLSNTSIQQVQRDRLRKHFTPLNFDQVSENTTIIMKPVPDCMQNNVDDLFHGLNDADFDTFW